MLNKEDALVEIRATNSGSYRFGEWATVVGLVQVNSRPCYMVEFADGDVDQWPVYDPWDSYEFRRVGSKENS